MWALDRSYYVFVFLVKLTVICHARKMFSDVVQKVAVELDFFVLQFQDICFLDLWKHCVEGFEVFCEAFLVTRLESQPESRRDKNKGFGFFGAQDSSKRDSFRTLVLLCSPKPLFCNALGCLALQTTRADLWKKVSSQDSTQNLANSVIAGKHLVICCSWLGVCLLLVCFITTRQRHRLCPWRAFFLAMLRNDLHNEQRAWMADSWSNQVTCLVLGRHQPWFNLSHVILWADFLGGCQLRITY